jgi:PKD repeat protein
MKKLLFILLSILSINMYSQVFTPDFTYTVNAGGQVSFTNTSSGYSGAATYSWDFGDNSGGSTLANPSYTYGYNYTYNVVLSITDGGMFDTIGKQVTIITASQNASCPSAADFIPGTNGGQTSLTFPNSPANVTVYWGDGNGTYHNSPGTIFYQYPYNGTFPVTVYADGTFGQMNITCDTSAQNVVVSNVPCMPSFNVYTDTINFLINAVSTSTGATNYSWTLNGNPIGNDSVQMHTAPLASGTYTICLSINGPNGCFSSTCDSTFLIYTPVCGANVNLSPVAGQCDKYNASVSGGGVSSYTWYVDGMSVSSAANPQLTLNFGSTDNMSTISWALSGSGCTEHGYADYYNPAGFFLALDTTTSINTWFVYPNNSQAVTFEQWDFGDGTTSSAQYPTHNYAAPGYYQVGHTITLNGCSYTYQYTGYFFRTDGTNNTNVMANLAVVPTPTGIKEIKSTETSVFPNPTSGELTIRPEGQLNEICLIDISGKCVFMKSSGMNGEIKISLGMFENGMYTLILKGKSGVSTRKIALVK